MGEMKKEIKDYLHLYMGCDCQDEDGRKGWLSGFDVCERDYSITMLTMRYPDSEDDYQVFNDNEQLDRIKLLLRPLSSMTEEEATQYIQGEFGNDSVYNGPSGWHNAESWLRGIVELSRFKQSPEGFRLLLSKGFDLFGLIDAGLAIDKTKQP